MPDRVKIGFKDYIVTRINDNVVSYNKVCYGAINFNNCEINISTLYSDDIQKCTLIHEIIHGIDDIYMLDLKEEQVEQLAKGLYAFIKDNSDMFKTA